MSAVRRDPALAVFCPTCKAVPGALCRTQQGFTVGSHDSRFAAYIEQRQATA